MTQCEIGRIGWIDKNVLLVDIESGMEIGVEHVAEFHNVAAELAQEQKIYSIVNYGAYSLPTREARDLCESRRASSQVLGRALVVHDLGQFIVAKHSLKRQQKDVPTRIFTDLELAQKWVRTLQNNALEHQIVAI